MVGVRDFLDHIELVETRGSSPDEEVAVQASSETMAAEDMMAQGPSDGISGGTATFGGGTTAANEVTYLRRCLGAVPAEDSLFCRFMSLATWEKWRYSIGWLQHQQRLVYFGDCDLNNDIAGEYLIYFPIMYHAIYHSHTHTPQILLMLMIRFTNALSLTFVCLQVNGRSLILRL